MYIKDLKNCPEITAGDNTRLRELLNPLKEPVDIRYSLAQAVVAPGKTSLLHRMKTAEVYYITSGEGQMFIDGEIADVSAGQMIYIPPQSAQRIKNTGAEDLVFICIVDPAWRAEDEEVMG